MQPSPKRCRTQTASHRSSTGADGCVTGAASELVLSTAEEAFLYVEKLAADAEKSANDAMLDVDNNMGKLRSTIMAMVDAKVDELKAEIHDNLVSSLKRLKTLQPMEYSGEQRLIFPGERLAGMLETEFEGISIFRGKHILDVPFPVLSQIIGYLPPESILATRAACYRFWEAVCAVYSCESITFTTQAEENGEHTFWRVIGGDIIVTPYMDFRVEVEVEKKARAIGVYLRAVKKKLYAQHTRLDIEVTYDDNNTKKQLGPARAFITNFGLSRIVRDNRGKGRRFVLRADEPMPSKVVDVTVRFHKLEHKSTKRRLSMS
ncbi:hypothetical protein Pelo_5458 [Pelomyxa schiedti]|nr:hypothetical protein Pelo_5458 [Pelomyxa schiedti]